MQVIIHELADLGRLGRLFGNRAENLHAQFLQLIHLPGKARVRNGVIGCPDFPEHFLPLGNDRVGFRVTAHPEIFHFLLLPVLTVVRGQVQRLAHDAHQLADAESTCADEDDQRNRYPENGGQYHSADGQTDGLAASLFLTVLGILAHACVLLRVIE